MSHAEFVGLAADIDALEFDTVFRIIDGEMVPCDNVWAPSVYHDDDDDVSIDGHDGWQCFTGLTGQYGYSGAVMHSSEYVGCCIAKYLAEYASEATDVVFALVVVNDLDDMEYPAGWAITYREYVTVGSEQ